MFTLGASYCPFCDKNIWKKKDQLKNERASGNSQHGGGGMDTGT